MTFQLRGQIAVDKGIQHIWDLLKEAGEFIDAVSYTCAESGRACPALQRRTTH